MFGRVAASALAWGLVAVLVIWPAASGDDNGAFVQANAPPSAVAADPAAEPFRAEAENQARLEEPVQEPQQNRKSVQDEKPEQDNEHRSAQIATPDTAEHQTAPPALPEPFGLETLPVAGGPIVDKWNGVTAAIASDRKILAGCRESAERCPAAARGFLAAIAAGSTQTGRARIGLINRAVNLGIRAQSDLAQWGVLDRWSAPLETYSTGRGDCEDYAIAKYVALTEAGIAPQDVKLVVVRNTAADEDHAVTAVRLDGAWIMLDNRWLTLVADVEMPQVVPLFVLDSAGVRQFVPEVPTAARGVSAPASF
jgi:predicted transglutaminase-like cysteine proteinase